jgi:tetraprenyl-beta-curcumene synthase
VGSAARETWAAASALGAYLTTVLPAARRELRRWGQLPPDKAKNAEAVAVFATLAPRPMRATVVRAIVALQVAIDLRDALEENGDRADPATAARLERLEACWRRELAWLPAHAPVAPLLERAVGRCEEGQRRTHAAATGDSEPLRRWAEGLEAPAVYRWWEVAAGASSSVAAHALIAAAADPDTTAEGAAAIDAAYHPPIGALTVFLDDLVDCDADRAAGEHNYMTYYESAEEAAACLGLIADRAGALAGDLPRAGRHRAILAGVAAFYLGEPGADSELGRPVRRRLLESLGPGTRLLSSFIRLRPAAERKRPGQAGNSPGP